MRARVRVRAGARIEGEGHQSTIEHPKHRLLVGIHTHKPELLPRDWGMGGWTD